MKFIVFYIIFLSNAYSGPIPEYLKPNLEMSSSYTEGYNAPAMSLFINSTPTINDKRNLGITMTLIDGQNISGVWTKIDGEASFPYYREDGFKIGNFKLTEENNFSISVHQESLFVDFLTISFLENNSPNVVSLKQSLQDISGLKDIGKSLVTKSSIMFKGFEQNKGVYKFTKANKLVKITEENKAGRSYLFSPSFNRNGNSTYKVRLGGKGELSESRPDQIILNSGGVNTVIAYDADYKSRSRWKSFRNGVSLNDNNEVCFVAEGEFGNYHIVRSMSGKNKVYVSEGSDVKKITYFTPIINTQGLIAFRGEHKSGKAGIFISNGKKVKTLILEGDFVETVAGKVEIGTTINMNPFGGNIAMNNLGDIVFNSAIIDPVSRKSLGRALISIYSK